MITAQTPRDKILELGRICEQKNNCCRFGSGFLAPDDFEIIAKKLKIGVDELKEKYLESQTMFNKTLFRPKLIKKGKPFGCCIFFENGCKIHKVKPLQCKTGNCSKNGEELSAWFLVNYIVDKDDPESIRQYASYIKSGGKVIKGGKLEDIVPNAKKLAKILNYEILR